MSYRARAARESQVYQRQQLIDAHWYVKTWEHHDAYNTPTKGVSVYRDGTLIAEGPLKGPPWRRTTKMIPKLPGLPEDVRKRFSGRRR